jgi:hypothetical protein
MTGTIDTSYQDKPYSAADVYRARTEKRAPVDKDGKVAEDRGDAPGEEKAYRVTISDEALKKAGFLKETGKAADKTDPENQKESAEVEELQRLDKEVRAHEQAHVMAGGSLVRGAASFSYKSGPDGNLYAVNGEVAIDSSPVDGDPQATINKMEQVQKAALAPAQPSGQDQAVAAAAMNIEMDARRQLTAQKTT